MYDDFDEAKQNEIIGKFNSRKQIIKCFFGTLIFLNTLAFIAEVVENILIQKVKANVAIDGIKKLTITSE